MNAEFIENQLRQLAASLSQISDHLSSEARESAPESLGEVLNARLGILTSIIALNTFRWSEPTDSNEKNDRNILYPGQLCLAPRFSNKALGLDMAVVLSASEDTQDHGTGSDKVFISWISPQSKYELLSSSKAINFAMSQVNSSLVFEYYSERLERLNALGLGDRVLCRSENAEYIGCWEHGIIVDVRGQTLAVKIFDQSNEYRQELFDRDLNEISPLYSVNHVISNNQYTNETLKSNDDGRVYSDSSTSEEGVSRAFNYTKAVNTNSLTDYGDIDLVELNKFGKWEVYTKGVGSKLLLRMGYTRGKGLGKERQGLLAPVQGLLKALPPGLSLDYLRVELIKQQSNEEAKNAKLTLKSTHPVPEKTTVFDFLNTMQQQPAASTNDMTRPTKKSMSSIKQKLTQGSKNIF